MSGIQEREIPPIGGILKAGKREKRATTAEESRVAKARQTTGGHTDGDFSFHVSEIDAKEETAVFRALIHRFDIRSMKSQIRMYDLLVIA